VLGLALACEGAIGTSNGVGAQRDRDAGADPDPAPDPSSGDAGVPDGGPALDAGTETDAGTDGGVESCVDGPLATPIPSCSPDPVPSSGDVHEDCVARINQFRWQCQCLPPLSRWVEGESCTDGNAEHDSVNGIHASFFDLPCGSGGRAQNECPAWPSNDRVIAGCLQDMWSEGPEDGNPDTINGHYESMASTSYTRVACGFFTTPSGSVWGVQNFD